jgi:PqqD family protein of HPr-rel-A system
VTQAQRPAVRDDLTVVELDGEAVVYDEETGDLHHLNPTATLVFRLCDGTGTARELAADIAEAYRQPPHEVERQIRGLLRRFRRAGLLRGPSRLAPAGATTTAATATPEATAS